MFPVTNWMIIQRTVVSVPCSASFAMETLLEKSTIHVRILCCVTFVMIFHDLTPLLSKSNLHSCILHITSPLLWARWDSNPHTNESESLRYTSSRHMPNLLR